MLNDEVNALRVISRAMDKLDEEEATRVRHWFGEKYVSSRILATIVEYCSDLKEENEKLKGLIPAPDNTDQ